MFNKHNFNLSQFTMKQNSLFGNTDEQNNETKQQINKAKWGKPKISNYHKPEDYIKVPIIGTIDSATGRITYYNKNGL